mgnify:CR=1 FL=1
MQTKATTPDADAVVFGEQALSYRELNARANSAPHELAGRLDAGVLAEVQVHEHDVDRARRDRERRAENRDQVIEGRGAVGLAHPGVGRSRAGFFKRRAAAAERF